MDEFIDGESEETRKRSWLRRRRAALITDAKVTSEQHRRRREVVYFILQASRIPLLILAFLSFVIWQNWTLTTIFFVLSVPMPGIAVVIANERNQKRDPRQPVVYKPAIARELRRAQEIEAENQRALPSAPEVIDENDDKESGPDEPKP